MSDRDERRRAALLASVKQIADEMVAGVPALEKELADLKAREAVLLAVVDDPDLEFKLAE